MSLMHENERLYLSEFFERPTPHRNPQTYMQMREALLALYREDPARRLTFTEARGRVQGDVTALHRHGHSPRWGARKGQVYRALESERVQLETARRNLDGQRAQLRDARRARAQQQQGGGGGGGEPGLQLPLAGLPPAAAAALTAMGASGGLTQQQAAAAAQAATTAAAQMKQMQGGGG
ncbi:SWI/SNF complex subunit SWI3A [Tetrabaena socialis]|uniref:SWI/SNF complex subunit SWI3A n=1 Tax=Tetrabaena socialis TaxID=47790 RepID=A0A2J7ZS35_9CHLO|nr:SWI/SNF complex subunit SWI3A [Tetrabaena socialis]|eukprot:PNH03078.1 SWI/SNF complex subunit SWI3A [Tetrabaena socialis]